MKMTLSIDGLQAYLMALLHTHLPDGYQVGDLLRKNLGMTLERVEFCFSHIKRKYYFQDSQVVFDHLHSDHMAMLIYFLANTIWRETGDTSLPTRLFYLNKIMHGLDLYYSVLMPEIFLLIHPVGTVLGNASYKNFLVVYQNVTVGADTDVYPKFGEEVILYSRSSVLGDCVVGRNVVFAANTFVINTDIPENVLVVGQYPNQRHLPNVTAVRSRCFG